MNVQAAQSNANQPAAAAPIRLSRLVLTGFMGAGKTTVGRLLAERLAWDFLDLDAYIESRTGLTVSSIFATHGEPHFRQLESEALASALARCNIVLALGGGTPEILTNRLLIEQTPSTAAIFLDAAFPVLYNRCMSQSISPHTPANPAQARPILADPAVAEARFRARQPIYRGLARHTVDTSDLTTEQIVDTLLTRLRDQTGGLSPDSFTV